MSASSYTRLFLAGLSILIVWTLIDVLAHRLFLAPIYASTPHLWRPFDQMNVALISTVTFGLIAIFVASYRLLVRPKSLRAGPAARREPVPAGQGAPGHTDAHEGAGGIGPSATGWNRM